MKIPFFKKNNKKKYLIAISAIIIFATVFRFALINLHDAYTDEVLIGFRSIGMVDFLFSSYQTTPWEWMDNVPWWGHLSFHDHPLIVFLLEHLSITIFGPTLLAIRLPAVLAGIASIWFIYIIAKELFGVREALFSALILSVQSYHVFISRIGLQDGFVVFFMLLSIYICILAVKNKNIYWWIALGSTLGFGIITKYTSAISIPIIILYIFIYDKKLLLSRHLLYSLLALIIVTVPSWLYNLILYKKFGHFDFQISQFLGQNVEKWQIRIGRNQSGELKNRIIAFFGSMKIANSFLFNIIAGLSVVSTIILWIKNEKKSTKFVLFSTVLIWFWFWIVGASPRFVVIIIPFFVLLIASLLSELVEYKKIIRLVQILLLFFIFFEFIFSLNTFYIPRYISSSPRMFAYISMETQNFGFNELDNYLKKRTKNYFPVVFDVPSQLFFKSIRNSYIEKQKKNGSTEKSLIIIYDKKMNMLATMWTLHKYYFYEGWPVFSDERFKYITNGKYDEFFREKGATDFLYITGAQPVDQKKHSVFPFVPEFLPHSRDVDSNDMILYLKEKEAEPEVIFDRFEVPAFSIYNF